MMTSLCGQQQWSFMNVTDCIMCRFVADCQFKSDTGGAKGRSTASHIACPLPPATMPRSTKYTEHALSALCTHRASLTGEALCVRPAVIVYAQCFSCGLLMSACGHVRSRQTRKQASKLLLLAPARCNATVAVVVCAALFEGCKWTAVSCVIHTLCVQALHDEWAG